MHAGYTGSLFARSPHVSFEKGLHWQSIFVIGLWAIVSVTHFNSKGGWRTGTHMENQGDLSGIWIGHTRINARDYFNDSFPSFPISSTNRPVWNWHIGLWLGRWKSPWNIYRKSECSSWADGSNLVPSAEGIVIAQDALYPKCRYCHDGLCEDPP